MKLSVDQQKELISDDAVHAAFLQRHDIAPLPPEEQEVKWQAHLVHVNRFREYLTGVDTIVLPANLNFDEAP
jgi:hypothetical protein